MVVLRVGCLNINLLMFFMFCR